MSVEYRRDGRVVHVVLNAPPVNAIGHAMRAGLMDALDRIEAEGDVERVILSGAGRAFAAGADAREFDSDPEPPHLPDVSDRIARCDVPWIAAIHGAALGGGAELALACRYRIARADAVIGLPEVTLGVVPGAGGTQRLPRLIGIDRALDLIPAGKTLSGRAAREIGLIDEVDDDPVGFAEMTNAEWLGMAVPLHELNSGEAAPEVFEAARAQARAKMCGQDAPLRAINLIERSMTAPFEDGMAEERATFLALRQSDQARALRHIFFAERAAKAPADLPRVDLPEHVAVVGGGTMGAGIAYALLNAGLRVTVIETDADGVERARANVEKIIDASQRRGLIDEAGAAARRNALTLTTDYADAAGAGLAIEAAFEAMEVKRQVFAALEAALPADAILASNTSYLDLNEVGGALADPSRLVGLHFFAPAHIMKLLEIVRGAETSDRALALGFALAKRLRKVPVVAGVCDGFIGNRILARYREAADTVFMDGSTPWEVDEAMVEFGYAMGPYEAQDLSGLDIAHANRRRQDATRDPARRYIPIADRMVELGKLGRKTGAGWYRYPGGNGKVEDPIVADLALEEAHFAGITRTDYDADEIRHRLILAMINEAADILAEGIAETAADIDLVTVFGYGFPRWRGGLMHHADTLGAAAVLDGLATLAKEDPVAWRPSPMIEDCARRGIRFSDWRRA
ncbi:enoyl-CoA hydratase/isomerase family protein [Ponticoccus sp. SC2-23]|uniref:3-hydroxyacyl-CoA dehydrogenase NAD-binding domain-containing protein n=1 Tax=Alexandriicola marinus TaxID=2081710 RepID=UPI000FDCBB4A|nr:3-hydroxyacyl-CoA dehydrogenase NAD-binding domain-containing protein [Alexandriicola marinus]MBM1221692.1 enoyl-CoA hydratase/isomerase family protein [Ponticoccus sp. SC6-9]MBM1226043.1 enoyl-CoA hydratase/isomerase family protein [Ponticoccus sp. SC6-15]MBM1231340.1 enoyl-CoA hydratase/isomerase family protein [Ponticoccus sp. SC6-38]MBM1235799.1 enoyl-CoA hydratase/isomerase family protein [Ponticoccus sp. SC6-45]MBM1240363.1 enoyl-CoA hydratase/isomerase family protein [Ponticoccus sp.